MDLEMNDLGYPVRRMHRSLNKKNRRILSGITIIAIITIILVAIFYPSGKHIKPFDGKIGLVINGDIIQTKYSPILSNNSVLISYNDIKNNIDKNIFFDDKNNKIIVTSDTKVIRIKADKSVGIVNNKPFEMKTEMKVENEMAYVPIEAFKQIYDIDVNYIKDNNVVVIDSKNTNIKTGESKKDNLAIRKNPSIKQPICNTVKKGEILKIFGEQKNWYKVRTNNGTVGYIQKKYIENIKMQTPIISAESKYQSWKPKNGKINLVWDQFENSTPLMDNVEKVDGLDIVSPTWFEIIDANGNIKNKADGLYVRWAKANGYKVWGLVNNGFKTEMTSKFLSNSNTREKIINSLLSFSEQYDLDGINIDFEAGSPNDKDLLTQFMREMVPLFKEKALTISIDITVKVESDNSKFYDRKALGEIVDYVILMSYDQYWRTSPKSGSVAQYNWVDDSISTTLKEIPNEKLIMGVPFYIRKWKEENGKVSSESISMAKAQNDIRQNNASVVWEEKSGQYYAEYIKGNAKYRMWIDDAKSINLKSSLALKYDLAGVGCWRRGYETSDIWTILKTNLKELNSYEEWKKNN